MPSTRTRWVALIAAALATASPAAHGGDATLGDLVGAAIGVAADSGKYAKMNSLITQAERAQKAGRYGDSLELYDAARQVAVQLGKPGLVGSIELAMASTLGSMGRSDEALKQLSKAERSFARTDGGLAYRATHVLAVEGLIRANRGEIDQALSLFDQAMTDAHQRQGGPDQDEVGRYVHLRAATLLGVGRADEAAQLLTDHGLPPGTSSVMRTFLEVDHARALLAIGRLQPAEELASRALKRARRTSLVSQEVVAEVTLGDVHAARNDLDRAAPHWLAARQLARGADLPAMVESALLAEVHQRWSQADPAGALSVLDEWWEIRRSQWQDVPAEAALWFAALRVGLLVEAQRPADALAAASDAQAWWAVAQSDEQRLGLAGWALQAAHDAGDADAAESWASAVETAWEGASFATPTAQLVAAQALARHYAAQEGTEDARIWLERAQRGANMLRVSSGGSALARARASQGSSRVADALVAQAADTGDWYAAVEAMEHSRARALADLVLAGGTQTDLRGPAARRAEALATEVGYLQGRIAELGRVGAKRGFELVPETDADLQRLRQRLTETAEQHRVAVEEAMEHRGNGTVATVAALSAGGVGALPRPGEALVTWHLGGERAVVVAWTQAGAVGHELSMTTAELQEAAAALSRSVADPSSGQGAQRGLDALGQVLLTPVAGVLGGVDRVILMPHGVLHGLPLEAMPIGDRTLGEDWAVSRAPSATVLAALRERDEGRQPSSGLALLGDPDGSLPGARQEVEAVGRTLGADRSQLALGREASESRLREALASADTVLISSHVYTWPDSPRASYVALAPDKRHDGRLTVDELLALNTDASLVVLAGCASGRALSVGSTDAGRASQAATSATDDVLSPALALQIAGARDVVGTLWSVDDRAAAAFSAAFFQARQAGDPTATAVQHARSALRRQGFSHPVDWAAFVHLGDASPGGLAAPGLADSQPPPPPASTQVTVLSPQALAAAGDPASLAVHDDRGRHDRSRTHRSGWSTVRLGLVSRSMFGGEAMLSGYAPIDEDSDEDDLEEADAAAAHSDMEFPVGVFGAPGFFDGVGGSIGADIQSSWLRAGFAFEVFGILGGRRSVSTDNGSVSVGPPVIVDWTPTLGLGHQLGRFSPFVGWRGDAFFMLGGADGSSGDFDTAGVGVAHGPAAGVLFMAGSGSALDLQGAWLLGPGMDGLALSLSWSLPALRRPKEKQ